MLRPATTDFLDALSARLPAGTLSAPEPRHVTEPRGRWTGQGALARPRTAAEVAEIVRACAEARVGIVPWGGGTGLVGGQLMAEGPAPVILSLERMAAVRAVYPEENVLVAEAGVTLAAVQAAAGAAGRLFPLSLASEGTATIGGNLATNAGGVNVVRWGNARDLCLGLEVVMADGTVWHGLRRLRKDNTGYDLRHLLIGSEGTLGIITAASLRLVAPPGIRTVALLVVESPAAALDLFHRAETRFPGLISAFELIGGMGLRFLAETLPDLRQPFRSPPDWMVLIELGLPPGFDPGPALDGLLDGASDLLRDGFVAQSAAQAAEFWHLREAIPEANRRIGAVSSHDISLPLSVLPEFIAAADRAVAALGPFRVNCFGHLGDGNLHYNVFPPGGASRRDFEDRREAVKRAVHDLVHAMGGSVSAEHGIGRLKTADLLRYGDLSKRAAMVAIKAALDPLGILNPGAILPG
jgi:FAD/FMN-containing dehydrogenase